MPWKTPILVGKTSLHRRIVFGSDEIVWPQTIKVAIESIEMADSLTREQKRDIFYNNAARFLRLDEKQHSQK